MAVAAIVFFIGGLRLLDAWSSKTENIYQQIYIQGAEATGMMMVMLALVLGALVIMIRK